jgi:hypothetical protein
MTSRGKGKEVSEGNLRFPSEAFTARDLAARGHRFSTFHRNAMGAMITPEMFERYAVGRMNWPVGTNGTNSNARR